MKTYSYWHVAIQHPILLLICLMANASPFAQSKFVATPDKPGVWNYRYYTEKGTGGFRSEANYQLTATQLTQFKQKLTSIAEVLHQNPVTKNPIGYEATVEGSIYTNWGTRLKVDLKELSTRIVQGEIIIQFCPLYVKDGKQQRGCIEVAHCDTYINRLDYSASGVLPKTMETYEWSKLNASDRLSMVFTLPEKIKELAEGVVAYSTAIIVVANPKKPYWVPVTVGELFDLKIAVGKEISAKEGNTYALDYILNDKAGFTPEQLLLPAYTGDNISQIGYAINNMPYVKINLDYFDKTLPRTAVQMITLRVDNEALYEKNEYRFPNAEAIDGKRFFEFTKALDGEKLRALLDVGH